MPSSAKISTFELLVKPIGSDETTFARTAVGSFVLTFSNLAASARLLFLAVIPRFDSPTPYSGRHPDETSADRELTTSYNQWSWPQPPTVDPSGVANHRAVFDLVGGPVGPGANGQTIAYELRYLGQTNAVRIYTSLFLEAPSGQTASFRILPFLGAGPNLLLSKRLDVRGFLAIGLHGDPFYPPSGPESTEVLLAPEQRHIFLPRDVSSFNSPVDLSHVAQTSTGLTPAEGAVVALTRPVESDLPANVRDWATQNGVALQEVLPFGNILTKIV